MMPPVPACAEAIPSPEKLPKPRTAKTKLTAVAVVCAKCAKRQGLRPRAVCALLKRAAKDAGRNGPGKVRVVESGCLGPCPKRAVAVATGASLAAGRVVLLDPALGPEAALAAVFPEFGPNAPLGRPGAPTRAP